MKYRVVEHQELFYPQYYVEPRSYWFFGRRKKDGYWEYFTDSEDDNKWYGIQKDAEDFIKYQIAKFSEPVVVWQSDLDEVVERAMLENNE